MGLHVYCIAPPGLEPATAGVAEQTVRAVAVGPIAVWVSEHDQRPPAAIEAARAHDRVIRSALDDTVTPVPLRFGNWFEDEAAMQRALADRASHWQAELRELAGTVEMGLRITTAAAPFEPPRVDARTGTAYMEALRERHRHRERELAGRAAVLEAVRSVLAGRTLREFVDVRPLPQVVLSMAHLVRRAGVDAYRAALAPLRNQFAELRFHATGPWPPYSFVA